MKYADASALLRVLFHEKGPALPLEGAVFSCRIVEVECYRAIERARLLGAISDSAAVERRSETAEILRRLDLMPVDDLVIELAGQPFGINVRASDAVHVAAAQICAREPGEVVEFWTHDERQARAAIARGLAVRGI